MYGLQTVCSVTAIIFTSKRALIIISFSEIFVRFAKVMQTVN